MEKRNELGFLQRYQNPLIDHIQYLYDGNCCIYFKDGTTRTHFVDCEVVYNSQFGIPLSLDGTKLYVSSWERGLTAYNTITGEKLWQYKRTRIQNVFCYDSFLIAYRYGLALLQFDVNTGELLNGISSRSLEFVYGLDQNYLYVNKWKRKNCIVDAKTLCMVKSYPEKLVNPYECLGCTIRDAHLRDGKLFIEGFESCRYRNNNDSETKEFYRMIDTDFYHLKTGDGSKPLKK